MSRTRHSFAVFLVALAAMLHGCGHDDGAAPGTAATLPADTFTLEQLAWSDDEFHLEYSFDDRLRIRVSADSWEELLAKARPTFTWGTPMPKAGFADMMWIDTNADGTPDCPAPTQWAFRLARAIVWKPDADQKVRWILLDFPVDDPEEGQPVLGLLDGREYGDPYPLLCRIAGQATPARLSVTSEKPPTPQFGDSSYAVCIGQHDSDLRGGAVYEIGWGGKQNLQERYSEHRMLYVWRDQAGQWRFLGAGPREEHHRSGHIGHEDNVSIISRASVQWRGDPSRPVVAFVVKESRYKTWSCGGYYDEFVEVIWPRLTICRDATLDAADGTPAELTWASEEYVQAVRDDTPEAEDDTLAKIVHRLAAWNYFDVNEIANANEDASENEEASEETTGWDLAEQAPGAELLQRREKIRQTYTERLRRPNPHLPSDDNAKLPEGTRVTIRVARVAP